MVTIFGNLDDLIKKAGLEAYSTEENPDFDMEIISCFGRDSQVLSLFLNQHYEEVSRDLNSLRIYTEYFLDLLDDYFSSYIPISEISEIKFAFEDTNTTTMGKARKFLENKINQFQIPNGSMIVQHLLQDLVQINEHAEKVEALWEESFQSKIIKKANYGASYSVEGYNEAIKAWNINYIDDKFHCSGHPIEYPVPFELKFQHYEAIMVHFIDWLSDEKEFHNISPVIESLKLWNQEVYGPVLKLLDHYQQQYESSSS